MKTYTHRLFKLTDAEMKAMNDYLTECNYKAFNGINNFNSINRQREFFYQWHLNELHKKFNKPRVGKSNYVKINSPEIATLEALYSRVIEERADLVTRKILNLTKK